MSKQWHGFFVHVIVMYIPILDVVAGPIPSTLELHSVSLVQGFWVEIKLEKTVYVLWDTIKDTKE